MTTNDQTPTNENAELVPPCFACPKCGQREMDELICDDDGESVACQSCGTIYTVTQLDQDQDYVPPRSLINDDIREIASLQRQIADLLNAAGAKYTELNMAMGKKANELERLVTRGSDRNAANEMAAAFTEFRVNTGELNSRLIDAIERRGHEVFPPQYEPIRSKWAIIENRA
jgi:transcription elongation factor Elf1